MQKPKRKVVPTLALSIFKYTLTPVTTKPSSYLVPDKHRITIVSFRDLGIYYGLPTLIDFVNHNLLIWTIMKICGYIEKENWLKRDIY